MRDYQYFQGTKASPVTPALKGIAAEYRLQLSDLVAAKKAANLTDFGVSHILRKASLIGLSLLTAIIIDQDLKWGAGQYPDHRDRFAEKERAYHGFAQ